MQDGEYRALFVAAPTRLRDRVLPTSAVGMAMLVLLASLGAAFSGSVLYAYYDYRLHKSEDRVAKFVLGFDKRFKSATQLIEAEREQAKSQIRKELEPLQRVTAEGSTLETLLKKVSGSLWFVRTLEYREEFKARLPVRAEFVRNAQETIDAIRSLVASGTEVSEQRVAMRIQAR